MNMGSFGALSDQQAETKKRVGFGVASPASAFMAAVSTQVQPPPPQQQQHHHQSVTAATMAAVPIHHPTPHHLHHHQQHQISFGGASSSSAIHPSHFLGKDGGCAYDLGELDHALFLYLSSQDQASLHEQRQNSGMRPPTLNIFPSQPMHVVDPSSTSSAAKAISAGLVSNSASSSGSKRSSEPSGDISHQRNDVTVASVPEAKAIKREGNQKGPTNSSSEQEGPKTPDPKTLRRLAQNREAARKSRLRKKAYVQQLESSRIKLTQLEQEIQRARSQGIFFGGSTFLGGDQNGPNGMSSEAVVFDMEYARWLEEHHRITLELRNAMQDHLPESELRLFVENCVVHYDEVMHLKSMIAKADVFHLVSGTWKTPAERCFMWMGGFRPSELIKIIISQVEPLTEQQLMGICSLQQSTQEAEEALSGGMDALNQSLSEAITSEALSCPTNMGNYMGQMAIAMGKLSTVESFVRQADHLRHQTLLRLHQVLTTRQAARCFLAIAEYFHRLRSLSTLWSSRPKPE